MKSGNGLHNVQHCSLGTPERRVDSCRYHVGGRFLVPSYATQWRVVELPFDVSHSVCTWSCVSILIVFFYFPYIKTG